MAITEEGKEAMKVCADKAEEQTSFNIEGAQKVVLDALKREPALTGEVLTVLCREAGFVPHDDRAFGAVIGGLSRLGLIQKVGYGPRHRGHGTAGAIVWALSARS